MIACINGRFVEEREAVVSIFDRGFLYGDGLFETMRVYAGRPFRWNVHLDRLRRGAARLGIQPPFGEGQLGEFALELIRRNGMSEGILRLTLTRGAGARGYSLRDLGPATLAFSLHPGGELAAPPGAPWALLTSSYRVVAGDPLSEIKSCNKLLQILARGEAEQRGAQEALIVNTAGHVTEAAGSNLFWFEGSRVLTPPLTDGLLPGVMRALTLELCACCGIATAEKSATPAHLQTADGIFLTTSSLGFVAGSQLDGVPLPPAQCLPRLREAYREAVILETQ